MPKIDVTEELAVGLITPLMDALDLNQELAEKLATVIEIVGSNPESSFLFTQAVFNHASKGQAALDAFVAGALSAQLQELRQRGPRRKSKLALVA